jgi:fumarylacetoacetate (FAA) hydrolase
VKLATLDDGSRDGRLVVVSQDLTHCTDARRIAPTLQAALDDWSRVAPQLEALSRGLALEAVPVERFHERRARAPLPRAYHWADGSAYVNHVELVRRARGATVPESFWDDPMMYQGGSDSFLSPRAPILLASDEWGVDLEAEIAVVADDVPMGASVERAGAAIRLVMLVNDVSLRGLVAAELAKGFGFIHSKPSTAFSPVAVTPDELGAAWSDHKVHLPLLTFVNGKPLGRAEAGEDMTFDFARLIAHSARTRPLSAGAIIGSGAVSNRGADGGPGTTIAEGGRGYSCLAEVRTVETLRHGAATTPFLKFGDTLRIEMKNRVGHSIFGAIEQKVGKYEGEAH